MGSNRASRWLAQAAAADAALASRAGGTMIHDTTRNITSLANMNYASMIGRTATGVNANGTIIRDRCHGLDR